MSFGGLGNNPFNPALVGRVFLLISFPVQMTSWPLPGEHSYVDATTGATPLGMLHGHFGHIPDLISMMLGNIGGSLGEIGAFALINPRPREDEHRGERHEHRDEGGGDIEDEGLGEEEPPDEGLVRSEGSHRAYLGGPLHDIDDEGVGEDRSYPRRAAR